MRSKSINMIKIRNQRELRRKLRLRSRKKSENIRKSLSDSMRSKERKNRLLRKNENDSITQNQRLFKEKNLQTI